MPTINKSVKKRTYKKNDKNAQIASIYNSTIWKNLRLSYIMHHPICEYCAKQGITKPATEVHHIQYISSGRNLEEMQRIAYNQDNLIALCTECHHNVHNNKIKL